MSTDSHFPHHLGRVRRPPGECQECDRQRPVKAARKMQAVKVVRADEVRRTTAVDLIAWTEERVLRELVAEVHKAGYVGLSWPRVEREPVMKNLLDEWELCDPEDAEQWFIRAVVMAVPR